MDRRTAREVIAAYDRRGKGSDDAPFVDRTRTGHYLHVDKARGAAREISQAEYEASPYPRHDDGVKVDRSESEDYGSGVTCPDCGHSDCVCET